MVTRMPEFDSAPLKEQDVHRAQAAQDDIPELGLSRNKREHGPGPKPAAETQGPQAVSPPEPTPECPNLTDEETAVGGMDSDLDIVAQLPAEIRDKILSRAFNNLAKLVDGRNGGLNSTGDSAEDWKNLLDEIERPDLPESLGDNLATTFYETVTAVLLEQNGDGSRPEQSSE
jgi:hypothetical protein